MRYQIERFGFWMVRKLAGILPRSLVLRLGKLFGRLAWKLDSRHRSVATQNVQAAFPGFQQDSVEKIVLKCYEFFGMYLFDMLTCFRNFSSERMNDFEFEGLEYLQEAYQRGCGVICFGAHFGAWEMMALAHGAKGFPLGLVGRRLDNPYLEQLLAKLRSSTGNFLIDKKEGFRPMLKAMREGKGIALLIDQNVTTEERVFVDFFGRAAATTPALALLKLKTEATLIPAFALPLPGNKYRFSYGPPVEVELTGNRIEDVRKITQECTLVLEKKIRETPEYWLWMHRRWKTRPEPEKELSVEAVAG